MKKIFYIFVSYIISFQISFASDEGGIFGDFVGERTGWEGTESKTDMALRKGDIHLQDIPVMIRGAIDYFIGIAGTIAIIFIIIGAYQIVIGSLANDKTKGKETIIMALTGFAIASLAWFIVKLLIDNLT